MVKPVLRKISTGIVAMNKERGSKEISAWPIDLLPELDDELTDASRIVNVKAIDSFGNPVVYRVEQSAVIKPIIWIGDTNRYTPPDVRRGERVDIYQVGNDDRYYWSARGQDEHLRRLETVLFGISANPDNNKENSRDNSYFWEWSSHDGHITLQTSQANGEKAAFTFQFDTFKGLLVIEDEKGNTIYLDSVNTDIMFENADGSFIQLIKDVINVKTKTLNVDAENINIKSKQTKWDNSGTWTLNTKDATISATSSATVSGSSKVTVTGGSVFIN